MPRWSKRMSWYGVALLALGCTALESEGSGLAGPDEVSDEGTAPSGARSGAPSKGGGIAAKTSEVVEAARERSAAPPSEDPEPAPGECPAQIDAPALVLAGAVQIRPPRGVEFLPDDNPVFSQALMSGGFVSSCDATVRRAVVMAFANDPGKSLEDLVHEFVESLEEQGYVDGVQRAVLRRAKEHHVAYEYPPNDGTPPAMLYIAGVRRAPTADPTAEPENMLVAVFEVAPDELDLMMPTFRESASSLKLP